jgi:hypothetical protein
MFRLIAWAVLIVIAIIAIRWGGTNFFHAW